MSLCVSPRVRPSPRSVPGQPPSWHTIKCSQACISSQSSPRPFKKRSASGSPLVSPPSQPLPLPPQTQPPWPLRRRLVLPVNNRKCHFAHVSSLYKWYHLAWIFLQMFLRFFHVDTRASFLKQMYLITTRWLKGEVKCIASQAEPGVPEFRKQRFPLHHLPLLQVWKLRPGRVGTPPPGPSASSWDHMSEARELSTMSCWQEMTSPTQPHSHSYRDYFPARVSP